MKTIKITVEHILEVPDNAEILTFDLEDFPQSHVLKMRGQLYQPELNWLKYLNREMNRRIHGSGVASSFEAVEEEEWEMLQGRHEYTWKMVEEVTASPLA